MHTQSYEDCGEIKSSECDDIYNMIHDELVIRVYKIIKSLIDILLQDNDGKWMTPIVSEKAVTVLDE